MQAHGLLLTAPGQLSYAAFDLPPLAAGMVRVRVAGCGLCHTDISFYTGQVRTRHPLPLVLGHEIAGTIVEAAAGYEDRVGRDVIVPAVIPCGNCDLCLAGHDNACQKQVMPGNDAHGGFADQVVVPARGLVPLPANRGGYDLPTLAVVADAVTTPYRALARAEVTAGDLVVIIGAGGIGTYAVQIAIARGATVAAIDIDAVKLERLARFKPAWVFDAKATDAADIKKALRASGISTSRWKVLEMSGTAAGQELAWGLLGPAATLGVVGFTMDKLQIRLSNLMAFDATAFGSWGCSPRMYPEALDMVCSGQVVLGPFTESHPIAEGPELFSRLAAHEDVGFRRAVLIPQ